MQLRLNRLKRKSKARKNNADLRTEKVPVCDIPPRNERSGDKLVGTFPGWWAYQARHGENEPSASATRGYILKEPYGKISLTESGIKAASSLFTSSVILCDFLHKQVGIDQQEADQDAVKIVAQVSEKSVEKLVKFALGDAANA